MLLKGKLSGIYHLVSASLLSVLIGCSILPNTDKPIKIESTPSLATISILSEDGQVRTLGKTPLEISESEFFRGSKMVYVQASLEGFKDNAVYVPRADRLKETSITLRLKELPLLETKKSDQINNLVSEVAKVQSLIFQKKYLPAQASLERLAGEYPDIAVIRDLLGNALYLMGKNKEALAVYTKAELLDPNNGARKLIINKLKEQ